MNKLPTRHNTRLSRQISNTSEGNATSILNTHLPPRRHMPIPYYIFPPCLFTTLFISRLKPRLGQSRVAELLLCGSRPDRQRVSFPWVSVYYIIISAICMIFSMYTSSGMTTGIFSYYHQVWRRHITLVEIVR